MTTITVSTNRVHMSPRKLRLFGTAVKNRPAVTTIEQLSLLPQRGTVHIVKLLKHAIQVAEQKNLSKEKLTILGYRVNEGPRLKRWLPAPRGRSYRITKRMSHITITLSDENPKHETRSTKQIQNIKKTK